jgi:Divergent InlB B-repeat domain
MKSLILYSLLLLALICCTNEYKLSVEVSGNGTYQVSPQKSNYEEGESVTITAIPDTGWLFNKWSGSVNTNYNPLYVRMDGDKYMELVFSVPYSPTMSGDWEGIQYDIEFHIQQALFDSSLTGTLVLHLAGGGSLNYSIIGYNRKTIIIMNCNRTGYYDITYTGWWADDSNVNGRFEENGMYYDCDLQRAGDSQLPKIKQPFIPKKKSEQKSDI